MQVQRPVERTVAPAGDDDAFAAEGFEFAYRIEHAFAFVGGEIAGKRTAVRSRLIHGVAGTLIAIATEWVGARCCMMLERDNKNGDYELKNAHVALPMRNRLHSSAAKKINATFEMWRPLTRSIRG